MTISPDRYNRTNPRHRMLVEFVATGKSNDEIAQAIGYSPSYVSAIRGSPLFQQEVADIQNELKASTLRAFAERVADELVPSLNTLVLERDREGNKPMEKITAADKIIGRGLDIFLAGRKGKDDESKRTVKLVIEGADFAPLVAASREVREHEGGDADAVGTQYRYSTTPFSDNAGAASAENTRPKVRPMSIQEFLEAEAQADSE